MQTQIARRLQNRLALAQFKTKHGWEDLTLDTIEPKVEEERRRKRLFEADAHSDSSSSTSELPYPSRALMSSPPQGPRPPLLRRPHIERRAHRPPQADLHGASACRGPAREPQQAAAARAGAAAAEILAAVQPCDLEGCAPARAVVTRQAAAPAALHHAGGAEPLVPDVAEPPYAVRRRRRSSPAALIQRAVVAAPYTTYACAGPPRKGPAGRQRGAPPDRRGGRGSPALPRCFPVACRRGPERHGTAVDTAA